MHGGVSVACKAACVAVLPAGPWVGMPLGDGIRFGNRWAAVQGNCRQPRYSVGSGAEIATL